MLDTNPDTAPRPHVLGPQGEAAIASLLALRRPLLAFDFDGTLAPIVARPGDARLSQAVASRLAALCRRLPVAVISGRSLSDLRQRLGFEPTHLIGNHGAEVQDDPRASAERRAALDPMREHLLRGRSQLQQAGVVVEDKGLSLALHHRLAPLQGAATAAIHALLADRPPGVRVFGGKRVVNLVPVGSPDKADALLALVDRSGADGALFAGDDVNDEPVFERAPSHWLTLRVGRDARSRARFVLDSPAEMAMLLEGLQLRLDTPATPMPAPAPVPTPVPTPDPTPDPRSD